MSTMAANFVSSQFLANSLVQPVMQAQSSLTTAMTEESTGQYANLGLELGEQSGYELSLKEQVAQLQTLTSNNSIVSTSLSTAQSALSAISSSAQTTLSDLATWTPSANSGASLAEHGPVGAAVAHRLDQCDLGRPICVRRNQFRGRAAGGLLFDAGLRRQDRGRSGFQTAFGVLPSDPAAANISASAMQSFLSGPFAALFQGASWSADWSSASSAEHQRRDRPGSDRDDLDRRQSARLSGTGAGLCDAERIRRIAAQRRRAAGRRRRRVVACLAGHRFNDQSFRPSSARPRAPSPTPTVR